MIEHDLSTSRGRIAQIADFIASHFKWRSDAEACAGDLEAATMYVTANDLIDAARRNPQAMFGIQFSYNRNSGGAVHVEPKIQRVLDAARAWRKMTGEFKANEVLWRPEASVLAAAIDALDASVERYYAERDPIQRETWNVMEHTDTAIRDQVGKIAIAIGPGAAEKIAAALNAAERKP